MKTVKNFSKKRSKASNFTKKHVFFSISLKLFCVHLSREKMTVNLKITEQYQKKIKKTFQKWSKKQKFDFRKIKFLTL